MGKNLAQMQQLTWDCPGEYDPKIQGIKPLGQSYNQWIIGKITGFKHSVSVADWQWIRQLVESGKEALAVKFSPTFVMHDYQESNVVVDKINGQWRVTGVFDLMENYFGDGESDLPRLFTDYFDEDKTLAEVYRKSYLSAKPPRPGFKERFPIYLIMDRLIIWEWAKRKGNRPWWDKNLSFRQCCEKYLHG